MSEYDRGSSNSGADERQGGEAQSATRNRRSKRSRGNKRAKKSQIEIVFKREIEIVSLDALQGFISACFNRAKKSRKITEIMQTEGLEYLNVVISKHPGSRATRKASRYRAKLKESPQLKDIPYFLCHQRLKTQIKKNSQKVALSRENVEPYVIKDLLFIYGRNRDLRLQYIPLEEKKRFLEEHSEGPSIRIDKEITVKQDSSENTTPEINAEKIARVTVNGVQMFEFTKESKYEVIGLDCEMVETERGREVGRVGVVDHNGKEIYNAVVHPKGKILDYLTEYSGLDQSSFVGACICTRCVFSSRGENGIEEVREEVSLEQLRVSECVRPSISYEEMINGLSDIVGANTAIVGHSLSHDMQALKIYHRRFIDISALFSSGTHYKLKLKNIAQKYLGKTIQEEQHSPVVDAESSVSAFIAKVSSDMGTNTKNYFNTAVAIDMNRPVKIFYVKNPKEIPSFPKGVNFIYSRKFSKNFLLPKSTTISIYKKTGSIRISFYVNAL